MASQQQKQMNELYASIKVALSKPDIDLATLRDIAEGVHLATREPEGVTYAEVDAGGAPALWCIPQGCDPDRVLLHSHAGGTVVNFMEKPNLTHIVNMGVYCMEPEVLHHIPSAVPFGFDDLMSSMLERGLPVRVFAHNGFWLDIGRVEDFHKAQELDTEDTPPAFEAVPITSKMPAVALAAA